MTDDDKISRDFSNQLAGVKMDDLARQRNDP
jgi:hypothetical protein